MSKLATVRGKRRVIDPDSDPIIRTPAAPAPVPAPPPEQPSATTEAPAVTAPTPRTATNEPRETSETRETHELGPEPQTRETGDTGAQGSQPQVSVSSNPATWTSALDDPNIIPGRNQARSNYVEDTAFARYRAAVYWLARNPDAAAAGVPENVSAGVNAFLEREAARLEKRFNNGQPFPATPEQVKKAKSRRR